MYGSGYYAGCHLIPSDVPLDRAGRRLPGWRNRPVCIELYYRWCDRWFCSGMAADRGCVVCAADHISADRRLDFLASWKYGKLLGEGKK